MHRRGLVVGYLHRPGGYLHRQEDLFYFKYIFLKKIANPFTVKKNAYYYDTTQHENLGISPFVEHT